MRDKSLPGDMPGAGTTTRLAGVILLAASVLEIAVMAHHPTVHRADIAEVVEQISRLAWLDGVVHGVLMGLMLLVVYGFSEFALRRGLERPLIRAGAIAYGAGALVMLGAALVDGFVVTGVASLTPHGTAVDLQINAQLLILCRVMNQSCANFGVVAMSAGIGCWSLDLLRDGGQRRMTGVLGCLVSAVPAIALMCGLMHLDVHGMMAVLLLQALWNVAVGVLMLRSSV